MSPPLRMHEMSLALAGLMLLGGATGAAAGGGHGGRGGHSGASGGHSGFVGGHPGGGQRGQGGGVLVPHANPGHVHGGGHGHGGHGGHGHGHGHGHGGHPGWIAGGGLYVAPAPIYGYGYGYGAYGYGYAPGVVVEPSPPGAVSYCPSLQAYYPDVGDCPGGWLLVVPAPSGY